ncbi:DUF1446-domain-containing protein [Lophiostoma macrostomum CBS 122681]|uniref:DUF1446-domain-containing protein n=1 Tax=Lophiostoma macrostomum CBS 122681 TaxID=1314788 RepID=A0A6A6T0C7_9PLEO|nr:DUF1446-domain-containing protein [Lophiostoma macrostomum CBS 122681]
MAVKVPPKRDVGDWLSEMNIAWNAITKQDFPDLGYEAGFLEQLEESIETIRAGGIKVITNAGALNTPSLTRRVQKLCDERGYDDLVVASVIGDDISDILRDPQRISGLRLQHLDHKEKQLADWDLKPLCGNAYIGARGIRTALDAGADIVICGRVTDASPVIGTAAWWHGWADQDYDQLAGALVAGHLIECGPYVCGANFSGFKEFMPGLVDLAFPIAEISPKGECVITKPESQAGRVTKFTVVAQLLYELQGEMYLNSDVVADLRGVKVEETGATDRVRVSGAKGLPPPPTTKAIIAAPGGFQAEAMFYINGLDVHKKAEMMKVQIAYAFKDNNFSKLSVELYGSQTLNPVSQQEGTVMLRVFAQARTKEDIGRDKFMKAIYALRMQSYPGYHMSLDFRTMQPKPFMEMFPAIVNLDLLSHQVILPSSESIFIPAPIETGQYPIFRPSYETAEPVELSTFGSTKRAPLGSVVHARSGDKADNSNVGFFVRHEDEYPWLQSLLTIESLEELFGNDWNGREGKSRVERCEFPNLLAVHFRILDFLDGGIASSARIDGLGKGIGEYLRSREVEVPVRFLARGGI